MDMVVTLIDNGKLLKPQTLSEDYKVVPYFSTIERDEKGNQFMDDKPEDWIYKMNGFNTKEEYMESIQRSFVIHDKRTEFAPEVEPDETLVTTTATLQLWKEASGRGSQVYALLDKAMPIDQAFKITINDGTVTRTAEVYNKGRTNLPSPIFKTGNMTYIVNGSEEISVGGEEDYFGDYNIMLEEYYDDFDIKTCDLEIPYATVYTSRGENNYGSPIVVNELYKTNLKPIHFVFDEENNRIVLVSDNDKYNMLIEDYLNIDGEYVAGYRGQHATIHSSWSAVSPSYKSYHPAGRSYELLVAWKPTVEQYGLKFAKIKVSDNDDSYLKYYYMIIDFNSENKYKIYETIEEAKSNL